MGVRLQMILEPIGKRPLLHGQFTAAVWSTVASAMQGTMGTALRKAFYVLGIFCAACEKHTNCLYNTDVSWGLTNLGVEGILASQILLTPEHPQIHSQPGS